jgi:hypothetical protein
VADLLVGATGHGQGLISLQAGAFPGIRSPRDGPSRQVDRMQQPTARQLISLSAWPGTYLAVVQAVAFPGRAQKTGNGPTPRVDRKHNSGAPTAGLFPLPAWSAPIWSAAMLQNLDIVDVILLVGAVVYFGLLMLRRI